MKRLSHSSFLGAAVIIAAGVSACSITTGSEQPTNPGNGTPNGNGSSSSGGTDNSNSSGGTPTTTEAKIGTITISQSTFSAAGQDFSSYSAMATFVAAVTGGAATTTTTKCTQSKEGDCSVTVCDTSGTPATPTTPTTPAPAGEAKKGPSAGDISVKGMTEITLSPDAATGNYAPKSGQTKLIEAGGDITVKAKGAEVPAFDKVLKAPSAVSITNDWPAAGTAYDVDRSADLVLNWENGTAGSISATISSIVKDKSLSTITCTFKADAGTGTITKAALGKLEASDSGSISVSAMSTADVDASGWKITVSAVSPASAGTGMASGSAKIK